MVANQHHKENQCPSRLRVCGSVDSEVSPCRKARLLDSIAKKEEKDNNLDLLAKQMVSNVVSQSRC